VEVARVLDLRERLELLPRERERVFDEASDLELPRLERDLRDVAEVEHGPVLHLALTYRQLRHPVAVRGAFALGLRVPVLGTIGAHVDRLRVLCPHPGDVRHPLRDEVFRGHARTLSPSMFA
jgi:hypothetical protein